MGTFEEGAEVLEATEVGASAEVVFVLPSVDEVLDFSFVIGVFVEAALGLPSVVLDADEDGKDDVTCPDGVEVVLTFESFPAIGLDFFLDLSVVLEAIFEILECCLIMVSAKVLHFSLVSSFKVPMPLSSRSASCPMASLESLLSVSIS